MYFFIIIVTLKTVNDMINWFRYVSQLGIYTTVAYLYLGFTVYLSPRDLNITF